MDAAEAQHLLADAEVVPCLKATIADAKELLEACLDADIPVRLAREDCCDKGGGCAPKLELLARVEDVARIGALLDNRWRSLAEREGTMPAGFFVAADEQGEGEPPCPACGHAAALVEGACADCGLQLA